ncbi:uncharacterized protein LOC133860513 [Alnus glutinosa]|uniref:uncharacterized protein LOC133860513 n=1 Tax=Alnus glutinosa TaxID=3517 RepID=UPI002D7751EC|nr:uncharacterized protein LOC133860513 [Alnus glutinosa]
MLFQAEASGWLTGVPSSPRGPRLNHLFFADDSLLFCRATSRDWQRLSLLLERYEKASGQQLNKEKTYIFFSRNSSQVARDCILQLSGVPSTQRFDKYLGLPALVGKSRVGEFKCIKDRIWKRLQDWKTKFLSQVGKEIMLKAVIQAIPTYSMSIFLFPVGLSSEINSLMQNFWWGHKDNSSKIHWMSWKKLGFSNNNFLEANLGRRPSFAWRSIISSQALLKEGLCWRLGDGRSVQIWGDKWLTSPSTFAVQSPLSILPGDATGSALIDPVSKRWNVALVNSIFWKEEAECIIAIPLNKYGQQHLRIWRGTSSSDFSVRSAYYMAKEMHEIQRGESSNYSEVNKLWKIIWGLQVPNLVKMFLWRSCHNILPTKANLLKKVRWRPPLPGCLKINWDVARDSLSRSVGIGFIVRDSNGLPYAAGSFSLKTLLDPIVAEALAALRALEFCRSRGYSNIMLEGDSLEVVNSINDSGLNWSRIGPIVSDIKEVLRSFQVWQIGHTKRGGNVVAHKLAKIGPHHHHYFNSRIGVDSNPLLSDAQDDDVSTSEDKIDELNIIKVDPQQQNESKKRDAEGDRSDWTQVSGNFFNHLSEAIRRAFRFNQRSIDDDDEWVDDRLGNQGPRVWGSELRRRHDYETSES